MKKRWCVSVCALRLGAHGQYTLSTAPMVIWALNRDEAHGIAFRVCRHIFPESAGWQSHLAVVDDGDREIDPDNIDPVCVRN